ncbi:MAG: segregation/condensation protein A [Chroococcidiopsidaceae cyanobacterium CP_BM_ER_R8_30]|nr:segregation/condensation protein A [Chroococcidiopsidaceae cyanobacterium CP_BM_ER_R8_30]
MDASSLFAGIALLIELAERGEIDPWDVQVIEVIDRYLSKIVPVKTTSPESWEAGLSQSGQAFLSASLLVLFKAKTLVEMLESPAVDSERSPDNFPLLAEDGVQIRLRLPLEQQLQRRPAALPPPKRRVTLKELIDQLRLMATQIQQQEATALAKTTTRTRRLTKVGSNQAAREIAQLAHQENLTEVAAQLELFLNHHLPLGSSLNQDWLNLEDLLELWTQPSTAVSVKQGSHAAVATRTGEITQHNDRVSVFWALLLLSAQSKVELAQEEFYQEIKIRLISPFPLCDSNDLRLELSDDSKKDR